MRNVLITGANTGIGLATAEALAERGDRIWLANRSAEKTRAVVLELARRYPKARIEGLSLDLADLASVRACAARFEAAHEPLHVLIANAGLAGQRGATKQGFELAFGTNHLGHFLLTQGLLPALLRANGARVVVVASRAHYRAKSLDLTALRQPTATYTGIAEYGVSKLANVLFAKELARRFEGKGISTYALHPGVVRSDIWRRIPWPIRALATWHMITNEEGAKTSLHCANEPGLDGKSGLYWDKCEERMPSELAQRRDLAEELWTRSEEWTRE
ncbi:MAG: SDR family oxidoreductase [Myxococcales bacterium]|nr:SDR family oxidoreductase [Myxococcales bacterium]